MSSDSNPIFTAQHNDQRITVLGTAHVSRASAEKVRELLASGEFDAVAVELCPGRHKKMTEPDSMAEMDLFRVLKDGQAATVAAGLALGAFQQRTAEQLGIEPGAEMRVAIDEADRAGYPVLLIDRDIGITLKRIYRNIPFWQRSHLLTGLFYSVITRKQVSEEEIERLKEGDVLESTFAQFAETGHDLYVPLIEERDSYMAARLMQEAADSEHRHILAIVGAGHFKGIRQHLSHELLPLYEEIEETLEIFDLSAEVDLTELDDEGLLFRESIIKTFYETATRTGKAVYGYTKVELQEMANEIVEEFRTRGRDYKVPLDRSGGECSIERLHGQELMMVWRENFTILLLEMNLVIILKQRD